jgi:hypothetical protein
MLLGAGLAISGCDHSPNIAADLQPGESKLGELKPGDVDYPLENPSATHVVQFIAIVPPTLSLRFWYGFRPSVDQEDTEMGDPACQRQTGLETSVPVYVDLRMQLVKAGDTYRGTVVLDRFAPGSCNWAFAGISVLSDNPPSHGTQLAAVFQDDGGTAPDYHLDEWCTSAPAFDPQRPEICLSLNALQRLKIQISPDFIKTVPLTERDDGRPVHVGPNTRTITVKFHDLDDELQSRGIGK